MADQAKAGRKQEAERIAQIRQRLAATTPGPWILEDPEGDVWGPRVDGPKWTGWRDSMLLADADFIAHAPEDVAYLLELLEQR